MNVVGADILLFIKDVVSQDGFAPHSALLLQSVEERLLAMSAQEAPLPAVAEQKEPSGARTTWRKKVKETLESIIAPDEVAWMDDDSSTTDSQYAWRAIGDLNTSFTKYVFMLDIMDVLTHRDAVARYEGVHQKRV